MTAVATENIESSTGASFEEEVDGEVRMIYRHVLTYGDAALRRGRRRFRRRVEAGAA